MSDAALLQTAAAFAAGLAPPLSPSICPFCFALFLNTMKPKSHESMLLLKKCHAFWDAMMVFICSDWTLDRRQIVSNILARTAFLCNKCKPRGRQTCAVPAVPGVTTSAGLANPFALVYQMTCSCLHGGVINHIDGSKGFGSKRGRWPTSADQLFPYGPTRSMASLVAQLGTSSFAESVITDVVSLHRPLAFPALLIPNTRHFLIDYVVTCLSACPVAVNADLAKLRQPVLPAVRDAIVQRHLDECYYTALMLHIVVAGPDNKPDDGSRFYFLREKEVFTALDGVVLLSDGRDGWGWLAHLATHVWHRMSGFERVAVGHSDPPSYARELERTEHVHANPYRALRLYLTDGMRGSRECRGPGCGKTVHDKPTPGAFARCGKCRIMQYCSRECQRADWKRAPFPHKEICNMLQELLSFAPVDLPMSADEFAAACTAHAYPLEHVDRLILWATDGEVVTQFAIGGQAAPCLSSLGSDIPLAFLLHGPCRIPDTMNCNHELFQAAQTLAAGLDPPFAPSLCPFCFALYVEEVKPNERIAHLLQPKGHSFWNATMAFVCADWTPERQDSVSKQLLRTGLKCRRCAHTGSPHSLFGFVFGLARSCIHAALINPIDRYKGFGRKPHRWPTTAEQLFPYGAERSISALADRIEEYPNVKAVMIVLLSSHRPLVFPPLMDHRGRLITCFVKDFRTCASGFDAALAKLRQPILPAVRSALVRKHYTSCEGAFALLLSLTHGVDSTSNDGWLFCMGHEARLFLALDAVAALLDGENGDKVYRTVRHYASQLWVSLAESERERLACVGPPSYAQEVQTVEAMEDPYCALRYCLSHRPHHRNCCAPGCSKTVHSPGAPRAFARCGRCRAVQYCSRECQRADWAGAPFPHKAVCDALQELLTFASLDSAGMSADEFSESCNAHTFPLDRVDTLIAWATRGKTCTNYTARAGSSKLLFLPIERLADEGIASTPEGTPFLISFPTTVEGRKISQDDLHMGMSEFKKQMDAEEQCTQ
ncbi:hypothetical protein AURDEDRAFT_175427 [Auricularia subglabra TFB-10046 SS5]|uniref:phytol kinase n=1 Tax=Auricularia subglabra (strain TFB-10046 / SS5) TaxID=717982 RepID=J0CXK9_AURST|nr:hypothetical protein AURDEDRAFT_175427 [Auricularia subglabra TFB-10046 SS5]